MQILKLKITNQLLKLGNKIPSKEVVDNLMTFENFFLKRYYPFSQSTKRRSKLDWYVYHKHLADPFGHKLLTEICAEDLDTWMTKQIQAKIQTIYCQ